MDGKIRQIAHKFAQEHKAEQAELLRTLGKIQPLPTRRGRGPLLCGTGW